MDNNCIFCKIIEKKVPSDLVSENEHVIAIKDISPKALIHILIIPKKHIKNIISFEDQDFAFAGHIFKMAKFLSDKFENAKDFKLLINNGELAGQAIFHLHMHFLAGENLASLTKL